MNTKKILIVEDNQDIHAVFKEFFEDMGYCAETAGNGREGIRKYRWLKPDVVVMDVHMPDMNGYESSKGIKGLDPDARIVMVTGHPQDPLAEKSLQEGYVATVMAKPCSLRNLFRAVASTLDA